MKRSLLTIILGFALTAMLSSHVYAQKPIKPSLPSQPKKACVPTAKKTCPSASTTPADKYELNILELTNSQMYRYGREMFLAGKNAEAAKVFLEIIRLECGNRVAHYHLQKIAERDPAYAFLKKTLKNLPCGTYDFTREDFLPASIYYEKDTSIILEQLLVYHKRQRLTEEELKAQADKYNALINELEKMVATLSGEPGKIFSNEEILEHIASGRKIANKFDKEIAYLKSQLTSQRLDDQKEVQDLRTRLAAAEAELASVDDKPVPSATTQPSSATTLSTATQPPATPAPAPEPAAKTTAPAEPEEKQYSAEAKTLMEAMDKARTDLQYKERLLSQKDQALSSLQERFDDILRRLKIIQDDLTNKNAQIKAIQTNLQNIQKP